MKNLLFITMLCWMLLSITGCTSLPNFSVNQQSEIPELSFSKIDRQVLPGPYQREALRSIGTYDPNSRDSFQVDLRSYDLSELDLRDSLDSLLYADFDDQTQWSPAERMPTGFDPEKIMELGKNPGLGLRAIHERGITGVGVGIAVIDQTLGTGHPEYRDQLRLYEEINFGKYPASMHGPATASLAVGKTVGVAPGADLYFIADWFVDPDQTINFSYLAQGIRRILEVNELLPTGRKIRVVSISRGYKPDVKGYADLQGAIREAEDAGILVISVGQYGTREANILGLGRDPYADPDRFSSYYPALFLQTAIERFVDRTDMLWVPIDARTTASPTGSEDYVYYRQGGMSWAEPYLAGVYALACQVDPEITPERFWELALSTGRAMEDVRLGVILDPGELLKEVQETGVGRR